MSKAMELIVTRTGTEPKTYRVTPPVIVAFERNFKTGLGKAFGPDGENRMEWMYWLAHEATRAAGDTVPPFDDWLKTVEDVEIDGADVTPFDQAPPAG